MTMKKTKQTFGMIQESEYAALDNIKSHVTFRVFAQLKRKYRGPGTTPDFLNAEELKRCGISSSSYSRSIRTLTQNQLLTIAAYKTINGYECPLFTFPHENGHHHEELEDKVVLTMAADPVTMRTDDRNGRHRDGIGLHHDDSSRHHDIPLRLDKEDKKEDKEETDEAQKVKLLLNKRNETYKEAIEPRPTSKEIPFDPFEETQEKLEPKTTNGLFDPATLEKIRRNRALS